MTTNKTFSQQTSPIAEVVASPCTRNCCLDHDDICVGCFRHLDEIVAWSGLTNREKKSVIRQCKCRRQQQR